MCSRCATSCTAPLVAVAPCSATLDLQCSSGSAPSKSSSAEPAAQAPAGAASTSTTASALCSAGSWFDATMSKCTLCTVGCDVGEELVGVCGGDTGRSNAQCMPCLTGFYKDAGMNHASPCASCGDVRPPACGCVCSLPSTCLTHPTAVRLDSRRCSRSMRRITAAAQCSHRPKRLFRRRCRQ